MIERRNRFLHEIRSAYRIIKIEKNENIKKR